MDSKDVEKYAKRYEASVSGKSCDAIADTFLDLSTKMVSYFLPVDKDKLKDDLVNNYMVKKELSDLAARVSVNYRNCMAIVLLTLKNVNFDDKMFSNYVKSEVVESEGIVKVKE